MNKINIKEYHNNKDFLNLSKIIDKYLIPQEIEKKQHAEVSTPYELRQEMINKIPSDFWNTPKKIFEPCSGKGGFLLDIIDKFMNGLKDIIKDEEERYRIIVEECLYWSEFNPTNVYICKLLLDPFNKYSLKYNEGDTLKLNIKEKWNIEGFNAVIGNPPYQNISGASNGTLWEKFVIYSINNLIYGGYLLYVHPSGWRNIFGKFKNIQIEMRKYYIKYLEIHNENDGIKTFKAETRYDWYLMEKINDVGLTKILFEDKEIKELNLKNIEFIPNGAYDLFNTLIAKENEDKCEVLYNRTIYGCDKSWVNKIKDSIYHYPCVYMCNSKSELKLMYSSQNNGHIGSPKVIWSNGRIKSIGSYIDKYGEYGLTCYAYAIVDNVENLENIKKAFDSKKFRKLMELCAVGQLTVNYKIIKMFRKDFWKEFI